MEAIEKGQNNYYLHGKFKSLTYQCLHLAGFMAKETFCSTINVFDLECQEMFSECLHFTN
jgi:hypothetical protein